MKTNTSPNDGVFEDESLTKPVSPQADEGFADFGGQVKRVARIRVKRVTLWVQPVLIQSAFNLRSRLSAA